DPSRYVSRRVEAILSPITPWRTLEAGNNLTINVPSATGFNGTAAVNGNLSLVGTGLANVLTASNLSLTNGLTEPAALDYCTESLPSNVAANFALGNMTQV